MRELTDREHRDLHSRICDVVERTYRRMPLVDEPFHRVTSDAARAAATVILALVGIADPVPDGAARVTPFERLRMGEYRRYSAPRSIELAAQRRPADQRFKPAP